jgi:RNA methyltransferase, TrmH family
LPVLRVPDAAAALNLARRHGLRRAAAVRDGGTVMDAADLTGPLAIVVGGEGSGLSRETIDASDLRVSIPMAPQVESLNVATAAALLVYEARRQRAHR